MPAILDRKIAVEVQTKNSTHLLDDLLPRRVSLQEFERLVEMDFFEEDERVELLDGIIVELGSVNARHAYAVDSLNVQFAPLMMQGMRIRVQSPIRLTITDSEPLPDVAIVIPQKSHGHQHPDASDVLLVIEVSDSSLAKDRNRKAELYARAKIQEYWLVNLIDDQLEIYREPDVKPNGKGFYHSHAIYLSGQTVTPLAFPKYEINVANIFPEVGSDDL